MPSHLQAEGSEAKVPPTTGQGGAKSSGVVGSKEPTEFRVDLLDKAPEEGPFHGHAKF